MNEQLTYRRMQVEAGDVAETPKPPPQGPTLRGFVVAVGGTVAAMVLGIVPLFGIPGAILYQLVGYLVFFENPWAHLPPDAGWPLALFLTLLWPLGITPGYLIGAWTARLSGRRIAGAVTSLALAAWSVGLVVWAYHWA